jgi:hypothetical protein
VVHAAPAGHVAMPREHEDAHDCWIGGGEMIP